MLRPYLPPARRGGKVLLTSRAKSFMSVGIKAPFRVETLEPEDAVKFLVDRTGNADAEAAAELAAELGYLPLALEQAAAYIETVGGGFAEYLARFHGQGVALFAKGKPTTDYPLTVATTWSLSIDAVRETSPASVDLLTAAAFLVPDFVPIEIFILGGLELGELLSKKLKVAAKEPLAFWELLEPLESYSLVDRVPNESFKLHRLTQEVVKASLREESRRTWAERVVRALNTAYPFADFSNWGRCERLQPSARLASELVRAYTLESEEAASLLSKAGTFLWARGDNAGAMPFHELYLEVLERILGCEHPKTLAARVSLSNSSGALGEVARSRALLEQTLDVQQHLLGAEHPDTLITRNNLAWAIHCAGDFSKAREIFEQILPIRIRVLGAEHPHTLSTRLNLAASLHHLGELAGARKLQEENLQIEERVRGSEDPIVTIVAWDLLGTLIRLNDLDAADQLLEKFRWLLDRDEESILSKRQRDIRRDLFKLLKSS